MLWRFVWYRRSRRPPSKQLLARSQDGLYDTALAESEREAVAELLGYLENVGIALGRLSCLCTYSRIESRSRLLLWRAATRIKYSGLL